ncbi:hypothetical protein ACQP00_18370 [Dactylosporangium sp. CS-047395]|uniref:hypothetical protein n=1 Tax=Dactylosporangium sp. CS-047395 TaxID=3239936 RepID=UPI003D8CD0BB
MRLTRLGAVLAGLLLLAACTDPAPDPAPSATGPAPCRTDAFTQAANAVLWAGPKPGDAASQAALPAALTAVDVRTGQVQSYCALPTPPGGAKRAEDQLLGAYLADPDLLLRTQYFSPGYRWFAAPGLPLVDVAGGRIVATDWPGVTVGLGREIALIRTGDATWCTRTLPPKNGDACTPLTGPGGSGSFVIGSAGTPVWLPAAPQPFAFDAATGYASTDGTRLYGAETLTATARQAAPLRPADPPVDLDPTGRGGFATVVPGQPQGWTGVNDWFWVESITDGTIRTSHHRTAARNSDISWMWGGARDRSRAVTEGGKVAVTAAYQSDGSTRFGALQDGSTKVTALPLKCPRPDSFCRILAWPDGSLGNESAPAP